MTDRLISLTKTAAVSLRKAGIDESLRAAVYLVLDHSGTMMRYYADGDVQRLAEQALGLCKNLDDDGIVPVTYFASGAYNPIPVMVENYIGVIDRTHRNIGWGSTNYAAAINAIVGDHEAHTDGTLPGLVIFQTDGDPDSERAAKKAIRDASHKPLFFAFVGFGPQVRFLRTLDDLSRRAVDNASFFHASSPRNVTDTDLYDGITTGFAQWLTDARKAGILP